MNTLQRVDHKLETKQETNREPINLKERLKGCFPKDLSALLYTLFILIYLVCAVIHFVHTGDPTTLTVLLPYLSAYAGIHKVAPLLLWSKKEDNSETVN